MSLEPETLTKDFRKQMALTELVDDLRTQVDDYFKLSSDVDDASEELEEEEEEELEEEEEEEISAVVPVAPLPVEPEMVNQKNVMATWQPNADDALAAHQLIALFLAIFISQLARRKFHVQLAGGNLKNSTATSVSLLLVSTISGFLVFLLFEMTSAPSIARHFPYYSELVTSSVILLFD